MEEALSESYLQWIKGEFNRSPYWQLLGITIEQFEPGNVVLKMPVKDELMNSSQIMHGGAVVSLLDSIIAANIRSSQDVKVATVSFTTNFVAPVRKGMLYATATITNPGKRIQYAEAKVIDDGGALIATAMGTFATIKQK
jgi:uncharacterized protein (TIGR00369 family)